MKEKYIIYHTVAKCKIYPDSSALVCIQPKSNDYMCTKKTYLFPLPLMVLPMALSSPVITTFNFIHGSLRRHRLYEQNGSDTSHPAFHYSLFSFSVRDSFLSGSHLESTECSFPAGRCVRGLWNSRGGSMEIQQIELTKKRLPLHKLPAFPIDRNHSMFLLTMVVHLYIQRYLGTLIPELLHPPFTFYPPKHLFLHL